MLNPLTVKPPRARISGFCGNTLRNSRISGGLTCGQGSPKEKGGIKKNRAEGGKQNPYGRAFFLSLKIFNGGFLYEKI